MMFSIVIPLYNKAKSIAATIQSILDQSFADFELIIVDDGSTDDSVRVVNQFTDKRIRLIQKENGGVCSARNVGILHAQCDFIALLDADDQWDTDYLLEQQKLINEFPQASMWGINFAELFDGKLIHELETALPKGYRGVVENYFSMQGRVSDLFCSSSVVIRKSAFDVAGLFDERLKYSEDIDMWYRIIIHFPVVFYDRYMAFYQYDAENRAMNNARKLRYFLPYYVDKYSIYKSHTDFYTFIQRWSAVHIRPYYFGRDKTQRADAKVAVRKLDYSVLPTKYRYLFKTPHWLGRIVYVISNLKQRLLK